MSVQQPTAPSADPLRALRWVVLGAALVLGVTIGAAISLLHSEGTPGVTSAAELGSAVQSGPGYTWAAGQKPAPGFTLRGENGRPIALEQFRGRPVILTFIDPLCRNLCPFEAKTLDRVAASFPADRRPAIIAVSTNHWADARKNLALDRKKWKLPSDWHWAVGSPSALARVWKDYAIGVSVATKTIAGIKVRRITHTEASLVLDGNGYQRALYLYPFKAQDVARTLRSLARA